MFLVLSCTCLCPIYWSHVSSWEWRCSWSNADRRCSNYIWVTNNIIAHKGASYIRDLTVYELINLVELKLICHGTHGFWKKNIFQLCIHWIFQWWNHRPQVGQGDSLNRIMLNCHKGMTNVSMTQAMVKVFSQFKSHSISRPNFQGIRISRESMLIKVAACDWHWTIASMFWK